MFGQRQQPARDGVARRLGARAEEQIEEQVDLGIADVSVGDDREHVLGRRSPFRADEFPAVVVHPRAGLLDGQPRDGRLAGATEIEARLDGLEQPMSFGLRDSQQYADHLHRQLGGHVDDEVERLAVDDRVQQAPCPRSQIVLDPGDHPRCQAGTHQATNLGVTRVVHHVEHLASDGQILQQRAAVRP